MKTGVVVFPGSNCDRDSMVALQAVTGTSPTMLWHQETEIPPLDLIVIPGGFSHGDYLRAGAIAARSPVMRAITARAHTGTPVLGICNGFQILTECGLLPGALIRNDSLRFMCADIFLKITADENLFTTAYRLGEVISLPIAHQEGHYIASESMVSRLEDEGRIALRYCDRDGAINIHSNPNGSRRNIAGVLNQKRNVLGMMPHPERAVDPALGTTDGRTLFTHLATLFA